MAAVWHVRVGASIGAAEHPFQMLLQANVVKSVVTAARRHLRRLLRRAPCSVYQFAHRKHTSEYKRLAAE